MFPLAKHLQKSVLCRLIFHIRPDVMQIIKHDLDKITENSKLQQFNQILSAVWTTPHITSNAINSSRCGIWDLSMDRSFSRSLSHSMANILDINSKCTQYWYVFICSQMKGAYGYKYIPILNGLIKSPKHIGFWGNPLQILQRLFNSTAEIPSHALKWKCFTKQLQWLNATIEFWSNLSGEYWLCVRVCVSIAPAILRCCTHTSIDNFGMLRCAVPCFAHFGCVRMWNVTGRSYGSYINNHNISY